MRRLTYHRVYEMSQLMSQGSRGLMVKSWTRNPKVAVRVSGPAGIVRGGSECTVLSQYHD